MQSMGGTKPMTLSTKTRNDHSRFSNMYHIEESRMAIFYTIGSISLSDFLQVNNCSKIGSAPDPAEQAYNTFHTADPLMGSPSSSHLPRSLPVTCLPPPILSVLD